MSMKKIVCSLALLGLLVVGSRGAPYSMGYGKVVAVTPAAQALTGFSVTSLSVNNSSTNLVYVLVNTNTNQLNAAVSGSTAVPIPGGTTFTFASKDANPITSLCIVSSDATTNTCYVAGF